MRLVFLGSPPFATASFAALCRREEKPVALVTAPPRRAGRGRREAPNPLVELAEQAGVAVLRPASARDPEFLREFAALRADLGVVVSYGQILTQAFLDLPRFGCVNIHGSLLPRWRGASPVQAAILAGDAQSGVSLQKVVRELDAGAVLAERALPLGPRARADELAPALAELGAALLTDFLDEVGDGPLPAGTEQDEARVTHCRKVKREEARLDWSRPAAELDRVVRAMSGWPVAHAELPGGGELRVHEAEVVDGAGAPGELLAAEGELRVACGAGALRLLRVQRAGKVLLSAEEFLRGAALSAGERLA